MRDDKTINMPFINVTSGCASALSLVLVDFRPVNIHILYIF